MQNTVVAHVKPPPVLDPVSTATAVSHVWWNDFVRALPNIAAGIVFLLVAWVVAGWSARAIRHVSHKRERYDLGAILGSIVYASIVVLALLVAATIVFPSVKPGDVLATLGVGSVAVGFAFKDILQNLFAGILLLLNRPFRRGDQIVVKDFEGTVEHIESRATLIKTYDGRRVIIPNSDVYTSPVIVNTAFETRRSQVDVGIGFGDDIANAIRVFKEALRKVDGVEADPAPEVLPWAIDASSITLRARWWSDSKRTSVVHTTARVVKAIAEAAAANAIDLPFPTSTVLFHDQTDEADGDRTRQREGWPAGDTPPGPRRIDAAKPALESS